jgi:hypothetical protein
VKRALAQNYLNFIYAHYSKYPRLIIQSEQHFYGLGFKKMWPVGGYRFKKLANMIGFKNALVIRNGINKINLKI